MFFQQSGKILIEKDVWNIVDKGWANDEIRLCQNLPGWPSGPANAVEFIFRRHFLTAVVEKPGWISEGGHLFGNNGNNLSSKVKAVLKTKIKFCAISLSDSIVCPLLFNCEIVLFQRILCLHV